VWFCFVTVLGERWWQLRGWPVNGFLQLDPLVALGTAITTGTVYRGLIWAVATLVLTVFLGRFFCGWICPFGTLHQAVGWLGRLRAPLGERVRRNVYRRAQRIKYYLLLALLAMAAWQLPHPQSLILQTALQTGLLDPIPLMHRTMDLVLLPVASALAPDAAAARYYEGAWLIGAVFLVALLANLAIPRFYCRFVCPLGALFGFLAGLNVWRIAKTTPSCSNCKLCARDCEGACAPEGRIRLSECLMCVNCLDSCDDDLLTFRAEASAAGEIGGPDISRRGFMASLAAGLAAGPMLNLHGATGGNWSSGLVRPPGSLAEPDFLSRCIRCGQCMKICPTNIIHPTLLQAGVEGVWTPALNFRIGASGCDPNCIACGHICPTAAIRPLTVDEKKGRGEFADRGPMRLGLAFVDRERCLPWSMDVPCIVCQEVCPVTPKAIRTQETYQTVRGGIPAVVAPDGRMLQLPSAVPREGEFASGDFYAWRPDTQQRARIEGHTVNTLTLPEGAGWRTTGEAASAIDIQVRLQQPSVNPRLCTGCGVCEHACPVGGLRAIRVSAENESRDPLHAVLAETS
jgi:polyferredoxin